MSHVKESFNEGNIITASEVNISREMPSWKQEYLKTSNKVIMAETLSPTFVGMSFQVCCSLVHSHWSRNVEARLSLVESFIVLLAPAILCHKEPAWALERKIPLYF